jgi:surfeit locus 1 family protein
MLAKLKEKRLVWPTVFALVGLVVLTGLGTWQLQRRAWKQGLIAAIAERTRVEPVPLGGHVLLIGPRGLGPEYLRVRISGRFVHGQERHLYMPVSQGPGWHIITPMVLDDGMIVLVNRGWVPDALKARQSRPASLPEGKVSLTGFVRRPERAGMFTPANDPHSNSWFWRDLDAMLACRASELRSADCTALQGSNPEPRLALPNSYPLFVDAEAVPGEAQGWPRPGTTRLSLPNRHLEYALTWYGLALTLAGVYAAFVWRQLKD